VLQGPFVPHLDKGENVGASPARMGDLDGIDSPECSEHLGTPSCSCVHQHKRFHLSPPTAILQVYFQLGPGSDHSPPIALTNAWVYDFDEKSGS
jgi:hypothetical protein